jgi:hypothetical protein
MGESCDHAGRGAEDVKNHASGIAQIALRQSVELGGCEHYFKMRLHTGAGV